MLPLVLGAVALGTVGYGVKKYIQSDIDRSIAFDEKAINLFKNVTDTIDKVEEKSIKALDSLIPKEPEVITDIQEYMQKHSKPTISQEELQKQFDKLYERKIEVVKQIQTTYFKEFAQDIKIKKDKITPQSITPAVIKHLNSYNEILSKIVNIINNNLQTYELEPIFQTHQVLKDILTTKIIKNGELNIKSLHIINNANEILDKLEQDYAKTV